MNHSSRSVALQEKRNWYRVNRAASHQQTEATSQLAAIMKRKCTIAIKKKKKKGKTLHK